MNELVYTFLCIAYIWRRKLKYPFEMTENCRYLVLKSLKIIKLSLNIDEKQAKKWRITAKSRDTDLGVKEKLTNPSETPQCLQNKQFMPSGNS